MSKQQDLFDERYRKVIERHRQLSRGYVTKLDRNGIVAHFPISHVREAFNFSALLLPFGILFFLKACIVTVLGREGYVQQVGLLREGGMVEQIGAIFMQMDPITSVLSHMLGFVIG